jgi:MFS family permease
MSQIPRTIWAISFVCFFSNLSTEFVHCLLPIFLVSTFGTTVLTLGLLEGLSQAVSLIIKIFSGAISDFIGRRKELILIGYGLAAITRLFFPLANSVSVVFAARLLDRLGSGFRGAPRDALIADVAPLENRGACYGLKQTMGAMGDFSGPFFAMVLMYYFSNDIKTVLWFAVFPGFIGVLWIIFGIKEVKKVPVPKIELNEGVKGFRFPVRFGVLRLFSRYYWWTLAVGLLFILARISQVFLLLRAQQAGIEITWAPVALIVMSITYSICAYPAGVLSDRIGRSNLLGIGIFCLMCSYLCLAYSPSGLSLFIGAVLWGGHMGFTESIFSTMIADTAPRKLKGTAFGLFYLVSGLFAIITNVAAGWLWDQYDAQVTFYVGAGFALTALVVLTIKQFIAPAKQIVISNKTNIIIDNGALNKIIN